MTVGPQKGKEQTVTPKPWWEVSYVLRTHWGGIWLRMLAGNRKVARLIFGSEWRGVPEQDTSP